MSPGRLSDYPAVVVNVSCKLCPRRGRYKLARLATRFGPDALLDDVLAGLAGNCRYWHSKPRRYDPRCGARFEDLDRSPIPDVTADGPVHRQRQPAREDIPQPRRSPEGTARPRFASRWIDRPARPVRAAVSAVKRSLRSSPIWRRAAVC